MVKVGSVLLLVLVCIFYHHNTAKYNTYLFVGRTIRCALLNIQQSSNSYHRNLSTKFSSTKNFIYIKTSFSKFSFQGKSLFWSWNIFSMFVFEINKRQTMFFVKWLKKQTLCLDRDFETELNQFFCWYER